MDVTVVVSVHDVTVVVVAVVVVGVGGSGRGGTVGGDTRNNNPTGIEYRIVDGHGGDNCIGGILYHV